MATIAITFADAADGKVDVQVFLDGVVEGQPSTAAQKLAHTMLAAAGADAAVNDVTDVNAKH